MLSPSSAAVMVDKRAEEPREEGEAGGSWVEMDKELGEDGLRAEPLARAAGRMGVEGGLVMAGACLERVGVVQVIVWEAGRVDILDKLRNEELDGPTRVDEPPRDGVLIGLSEEMEFMDCDGVEGCKLPRRRQRAPAGGGPIALEATAMSHAAIASSTLGKPS